MKHRKVQSYNAVEGYGNAVVWYVVALDILGLAGDYRGMAPSAFDETVDGAVDSYGNNYGRLSQEMIDTLALAYRLSDLIIRGDYFRANGR